MTYTLALTDRAYSSWSLRGWLLFEKFNIPVQTRFARLYTDDFPKMLADFAPARLVPALKTSEGHVITESLAIAEELATRHPENNHWPANPHHRAIARSLAAEMHAGFMALREACPMNLRVAYDDFSPSAEVEKDLRRLEAIWAWARTETKSETPWLCGTYSIADAFFAPVAARIAGYGLDVSSEATEYVNAHLNDGAFRRWRAMGLVDGDDQPFYKRDFATKTWPGPTPIKAQAVSAGTPENSSCAYSGKPTEVLAEIEGRIFGFCNRFCRDKTVADPAAWPKFMKLLARES
ncbi:MULTISPECIES: glutathione S-transferase [Halocynthiibacter]|uniref:Glutathione S-transferase n=1 Tax=Halocynthiibacter halioticoli TaxID=2986804 RepID=A0AAE3J011_9RHOB|nr:MULTISPECIES: glutathione S-transferase [Halocynthiibacter]MCV6823636.1 glutathione S-transferase [Halocynthiibacter halioticoli]MCW4056637.1 glutathione S-transferase [Halocynthiibacter sp. SDUM655004]